MTDEVVPGPPWLVVDDEGVGAWLGGVLTYYVQWRQLRSVSIGICTAPDYSEAFWCLEGGPHQFVSPVDLIDGADELLAKLRQMPGFRMDQYEAARRAEAEAEIAEFTCWECASG